jgi:hypothetical protein
MLEPASVINLENRLRRLALRRHLEVEQHPRLRKTPTAWVEPEGRRRPESAPEGAAPVGRYHLFLGDDLEDESAVPVKHGALAEC